MSAEVAFLEGAANHKIPIAFSESEKADLNLLFESSQWKTYRKVLLRLKEGYHQSMLPLEDPNQVLKALGIVVGLNLSINQLGTLVASFKKTNERRVEGESKNPTAPV